MVSMSSSTTLINKLKKFLRKRYFAYVRMKYDIEVFGDFFGQIVGKKRTLLEKTKFED